jgi:hypothetical protein
MDGLEQCCKELVKMGNKLNSAIEREKVLMEALASISREVFGTHDAECDRCKDVAKEALARVKAMKQEEGK